ncbi:acetyl-CoA carboxylase biotin carboxylase subunit [Litoribrevibacter albus]|uniref:Biotin carboxylase n=1 Tax=Litoribrevibacter albus TaxID=1473156 RepID=A0AA37S827_9GAMM|nr:acetyl/propionyl/methylcrotonyl-CoA carboxylase subunit alpha [Litoribrevibacter albus]GLQ30173.1 3-methylcrotonyl-CoA carboxylase subunit alpha [Litoribrevibacter albus]
MKTTSNTSINKLLIANRGEIACRVIKTAQAMGIKTVAVYSEADQDAPHVSLADQAIHIGPAPVSESYLVIDKIIEAAKTSGADAIHPGYGFLSENSNFAKACDVANLIFVGPPASAIELMGSKRQSKLAMLDSGVPCIPGYQGEDQSDQALKNAALDIGLPVMLKASAGGGGRGMRLVDDANALEEAIRGARSEAMNAFGSDELIIEKAVIAPRHIEIQVFADQDGNTVYLGERDCSIQRRHQKVVEEAPSPAVSPELRQRMGEAAVNAAKSCNYVGAGTVEFLLDKDENFYFLEMNTRLQVEHPVTELITGEDLVEWQLRVASGEPLPKTQDEIQLHGHAIEVRLYAEDPAQDFCPQTGDIVLWQPAEFEGFRVDDGIQTGQTISPFYDSMLAKLIAYGDNREQARHRLIEGLHHSHLVGPKDNRYFLSEILSTDCFRLGEATTAFIDQDFADNPSMDSETPSAEVTAIAAYLLSGQSEWSTTSLGAKPCLLHAAVGPDNNWQQRVLIQHEINADHQIQTSVQINEQIAAVEMISQRSEGDLEHCEIVVGDKTYALTYQLYQRGRLNPEKHLYLSIDGQSWMFEDIMLKPVSSEDQISGDDLKASMDGLIIETFVQPGDQVTKGQPLIILEAMKMEHSLTAPRDGTIAELLVESGQQVKARQLLVALEKQSPEKQALDEQAPVAEQTA